MSRKHRVSDAVELIQRWYGQTPGWDEMVAEEQLKMDVGQVVYDLRTNLGLTQSQFADLVKIKQPIISEIENANYGGNTIEIFKRVCLALHIRIRVSCDVRTPAEATCRISATDTQAA